MPRKPKGGDPNEVANTSADSPAPAPTASGIRYGSICSGVGSCKLATHELGWKCVFFTEIAAFPSAVLQHHFPDIPNLGDFTTLEATDATTIDVLVGGTPCTDYSIAGGRAGMAGKTGNLAIEFARTARRLGASWVVWENVPGVLSTNGGADFEHFVRELEDLGFRCAWRVLDLQYFGAPQSRDRVILVGYSGTAGIAAPLAVLFEPEGVRRNTQTRARSSRKGTTGSVTASAGERSAQDPEQHRDPMIPEVSGPLHPSSSSGGHRLDLDTCGAYIPEIAGCVQERDYKGSDSDTKPGHLIVEPVLVGRFAQNSMAGKGTLGFGDDTHPACAVKPQSDHLPSFNSNAMKAPGLREVGYESDTARTVDGATRGDGYQGGTVVLDPTNPAALSFSQNQVGEVLTNETMHALSTNTNTNTNATGRNSPCVAVAQNQRGEARTSDRVGALSDQRSATQFNGVMQEYVVRRLTPLECERLQGLPDNWTNVPYRGKRAADAPRYRAIGNGWGVPVFEWVFGRLDMIDRLLKEQP